MKYLVFILMITCCVAADAAEQRSIKVSAMSEIKVPPDEVVLRLAVSTRDKELTSAKQQNDGISKDVLELAAGRKIPEVDIKVTHLGVYPDYGHAGSREAKPIAYDFRRSIEIRLTDFGQIEPFLTDAFKLGLTNVTDLEFRVSSQRQHQFDARKLAVIHAREKAEHLTELTGMKLGSPIHIEEDIEHNWHGGGMGGMGGGMGIGTREHGNDIEKTAMRKTPITFAAFQKRDATAKDDAAAKALTAPGHIVISAHITVEFEMTVDPAPANPRK